MKSEVRWNTLDGTQEVGPVWTLLYGAPGVGKTTLIATLESVVFLEFDPGGLISVRDSGHTYFDLSVPGSTTKELGSALGTLKRHKDEFKALAFDSLTMLQVYLHDEAVPASKIEVDQRRLGGLSFRQLRSIYLQIQEDFPDHDVVWVCDSKERMVDDKEIITPALSPAPLKLLNRMCRLVGYLYVETSRKRENNQTVTHSERRLQVWNNGLIWGKDSSGRLPRLIANPNMDLILKMMRGEQKQTDQGE